MLIGLKKIWPHFYNSYNKKQCFLFLSYSYEVQRILFNFYPVYGIHSDVNRIHSDVNRITLH